MKCRNTAAAAIAAALFFQAPLAAIEVKQVADFQAAFGYSSRMVGGSAGSSIDTIGSPGHLLYLPVLTLRKNEYLAPVLMIESRQDDRPIAEDVFLHETVDFMAKPAWKYLDDEGNEATVYGSAKRRVAKATKSEDWSKGLYDYEEFGGGIGFGKANILGLKSLGWDLSLTRRGYGNWHNDSAKRIGLNYNYYEKDMLIPALGLSAQLQPSQHGSLSLNYLLQQRNYVDSYVILPDAMNAVNPSLRRLDTFHSLKVNSSKAGNRWSCSLSLDGGYYLSNQNYWDVFNAQYFEDYYSFYSVGIRPELSWLLQGKPGGHRISFSYEAVLRNYIHRNIRDRVASKVSQGAQADVEHKYTLGATAVLSPWCSLFGMAMYDSNHSNQEYEPAVKYSYDLIHAELGVGLHY